MFLKSMSKSLKYTCFFVNAKLIHKHNAIFDNTVTKLVTILTKCFFSISEPCKLP